MNATDESNFTLLGRRMSASNDHMVVMYSVIFCVGLLNFVVIFAVLRNRKMHSVTNIYIVNLSIADACMICTLPFLVTYMIYRDWIFGEAVCKMYWIAEQTNKYASVLFLTILSVDRYFAICRPMQSLKYRTKKAAILVVGSSYVVVFILLTPVYMYARMAKKRGTTVCNIYWPDDASNDEGFALNSTATNLTERRVAQKVLETHFFFFTLFFIFVLPTCIMLFFYTLILRKLSKLTDRAATLHGCRRSSTKKSSKASAEHYRHVTKMIFAVIICHVICWMPFWFMNFLTFAKINARIPPGLKILFQIMHTLPYINSALNPILYGATNSNYRATISAFFCCCSKVQQAAKARRLSTSTAADNLARPSSTIHSIANVIMELQMIVAHPAYSQQKEEAEIIYHCVVTGETKL